MVRTDRRARREHWARLLMVGGLGGVLSVIAYLYSSTLERRVQVAELQRLAYVQFRGVQDFLEHSPQVLLAFRGLFMSAETIEREEFASFAQEVLPNYPEILAVHWAPRIAAEQRSEFEWKLFPWQERPLGIFDLGSDGRTPVPAPARAEYLPIDYAESLQANHQGLGFDVLASPHDRETALVSARLGLQRTSPVFPLPQDPDGAPVVAIYQPLYRKDMPVLTEEQRWRALKGHLIVLLRPGVLLRRLSFGQRQVEVRLYEVEDGRPLAIQPRGAVPHEPGDGVVQHKLVIPGRQWLIEFVASRDSLPASAQPLLLMLSLLALTLVLSLFLDRSWRGAIALARLNRELVEQQRELDGLVYRDALTGLPNRRLLFDRIYMAIGQQRRQGGRLAVCMLDLDGFKTVNDRFGHQAGDLLLKEVAQRMQAVLRPSDTLARFGGDEFVVVLPGVGDETTLDGILKRLIEQVSQPMALDGGQSSVAVSASIGVAFAGERSDINELLREADQAMYEAKRAGKACYWIFGTGQAASA
ncbi:diguanylate cyclase domain-containing protein [Azorhizophilus paspali]|uniref:Diguanylate cyclase domain-containing protein n=1 Tax=Azorhizophilus paspali TaxID=69963 RepID=A0ABV6SL79_AZOPA